MPATAYTSAHERDSYAEGKAAGRKDNRSERGVMAMGSMFAATPRTAENCAAWLAGFADGQREIGLDPDATY